MDSFTLLDGGGIPESENEGKYTVSEQAVWVDALRRLPGEIRPAPATLLQYATELYCSFALLE